MTNTLYYCGNCFGITEPILENRLDVHCEHCGCDEFYPVEDCPGWSDYDRWFTKQLKIALPDVPVPPARTRVA
jgi:hypothetical protein